MQLILASGSPRRRELMGLFGKAFTVRSADIDETMAPQKAPFDEVARVSRLKALAVERGAEDVRPLIHHRLYAAPFPPSAKAGRNAI